MGFGSGKKRGRRTSDGKFRRRRFGGVDKVAVLEYRGWTIGIYSRRIGITIKRLSYSLLIRGPYPPFRLSVVNKTSKAYAIAAAKEAIDNWYLEKGFLERDADSRPILPAEKVREVK